MAAIDAFSADLARLADLTDEELTALENQVLSAFEAADTAGEEDDMEDLADALDQIRSEADKRGEPEPSEPAEPVAASAEAADDQPESEENSEDEEEEDSEEEDSEEEDSEEDSEEEDPQATEDPEALNAGAQSEKENDMASVKVPGSRAPKEVSGTETAIVASADIPGYTAGTEFKSLGDLSKAFANRVNTLSGVRGGNGEKVIVASITTKADEDRTLHLNDPEGNRDKIQAVTDLSAITAAGGCCAPLTTKYDLFTIGETARPVRDALAGFQADRGGIRFFTPPTLSSFGTSTGVWTCDDDEGYSESDSDTWKVCGHVECPPEQEAYTQAITSCMTFGVLSSRVFPENVEANTRLSMVQQARVAESVLLSQMKAGSTAIAGPAVRYGAVRDILLTIARVAAWYRDRHRLGEEVPLRAVLPLFVLDILRSDIIVQPPAGDGRTADFAISRRDVENFFDQWGVNVTWTLDGVDPTANGGATYGDLPGGGGLPEFPTSVQWALYAEGSWLHLDGGSMDLGIIRDSKLVRSNDYMQFSEVFEAAVKIGGESLWVTSPLSVAGHYSPPLIHPEQTAYWGETLNP